MLFTIEDVVEVGHSEFTGGSVKIKFYFKKKTFAKWKRCPYTEQGYLRVIDRLDHCLISDTNELTDYCERFFLLDDCKSLYEDIVSVMTYSIQYESGLGLPDYIEVSLGKTSYKSKPTILSTIDSCQYKG
jgi:hypothetical protein